MFGLTGGWERGLWCARDRSERDLPRSTAAPRSWQAIVEREAAAMAAGAVLLDLSPFAKFDVTGPEVLPAPGEITSAGLDVPVGRAVYIPLLNPRGGIEADVMVTRLGA